MIDPGIFPEIFRFGEIVCSSLSCETVQKRVLPDFARLTGSDMASVCLLDNRLRQKVVSVFGVSPAVVQDFAGITAPCRFRERARLMRFPVHDAMVYASAGAYRRSPRGAVLFRYGFEHCQYTPLTVDGRSIGGVIVARRAERPAFTTREGYIADRLARFVTIALANADEYEATGPATTCDEGPSAVHTIRFSEHEAPTVRIARRRPAAAVLSVLSAREIEVFELLASGRTNAEIGHELGIALNTVKQHVRRIYDKLGARSRVEAVRMGIPSPA